MATTSKVQPDSEPDEVPVARALRNRMRLVPVLLLVRDGGLEQVDQHARGLVWVETDVAVEEDGDESGERAHFRRADDSGAPFWIEFAIRKLKDSTAEPRSRRFAEKQFGAGSRASYGVRRPAICSRRDLSPPSDCT